MVMCREQLQNNANKGKYFLKVDLSDLMGFHEKLYQSLRNAPTEYLPIVSPLSPPL